MSQTAVGYEGFYQPGLSQLNSSQNGYLPVYYQSQMDGLLSQDSNFYNIQTHLLN